jgi:hypothetical protein
MDSLKIGFFHDSARRDHLFTLSALEDAYRRSRSTSFCFRADATADSKAPQGAREFEDELTLFDAIALEPEFCRHTILRDALFLFDSAVDLASPAWRDGELDDIGDLPRVAALDIRSWALFSETFDREIPLLPAPLGSHRAIPPPPGSRIFLLVNDEALARRVLPEFLTGLMRVDAGVTVAEFRNPYRSPARQSDWLEAPLAGAAAHVHIGQPPDSVSCGRLIDSMNMRTPCVVFDGDTEPLDADVPLLWRRPNYEHEGNLLRPGSVEALIAATRTVVRDAPYAQRLVRNALREVAVFHEQVQNSLLPSLFTETYLQAQA